MSTEAYYEHCLRDNDVEFICDEVVEMWNSELFALKSQQFISAMDLLTPDVSWKCHPLYTDSEVVLNERDGVVKA